MPGPHPRALRTSLALHVASGKTVASWAAEHKIALRTAYEWNRAPEFKAQVENFRSRFVDRAIGLMAKNVAKAAAVVIGLATKSKTETVQLQAARAVMADFMALADFAETEKRMAAIEKKLSERSGAVSSS